jgi:hypothetical protein
VRPYNPYFLQALNAVGSQRIGIACEVWRLGFVTAQIETLSEGFLYNLITLVPNHLNNFC